MNPSVNDRRLLAPNGNISPSVAEGRNYAILDEQNVMASLK